MASGAHHLSSHHLLWVFGTRRMPVKKPGIQPTAFTIGMIYAPCTQEKMKHDGRFY
jgi:hypothetical protein